jgi:hypothetical protein
MLGSDKRNWLMRSADRQLMEDRRCDNGSRNGIELPDADDVMLA